MSAQSYSRDMAKLSVAKMLQTIGWNSINTTPLEILTDVLTQYLFQISKTANDYANEFGCTEPNFDHVGLAFRDCHVNLAELEEYVTFVDFAQPPVPVPKYPLAKEDNLNFLKPGSKECLTRPVHIHEYLPPISITEVESDNETKQSITVKTEEAQQDQGTKDDNIDNVLFKRPAEVSPNECYKRIRNASTSSEPGAGDFAEQQGRPTREISSVMMTTSGFISPAREGRLPDSRTPLVQGSISEPPSPEPTESPLIDVVSDDPPVVALPSTTPTPIVDELPEQLPVQDAAKPTMADFSDRDPATVAQPDDHVQQLQSIPGVGATSVIVSGVMPTAVTPTLKKPRAPRKLDQHSRQRKEKLIFGPSVDSAIPGFSGQQSERQNLPATKPRKSGNQANRELARQMKKRQQQIMAARQALLQPAELEQPMNLSTTARQPLVPEVDVTKVTKAKVNRTLAAARRKTEKLNTTITPIPMPIPLNAIAGPSVDKLLNEPDKKKVNILKKISNVRNEPKTAKAPQPEEDAQMHQMLPSDVTIELVDMRNNQAAQQQGASLDQQEILQGPSMPREKRKRKERVAKPRKVPKTMPISAPSPWEDVEVINRPNSPEVAHTHNFPAALNKLSALAPSMGFPFLQQFSGPGLIPTYPSPIFNNLLPQDYAARAFNNIMQQHNPYLAEQNNTGHTEQHPQPSSGVLMPFHPTRPGRPRKTTQQPPSASVCDVAFPTMTQGLVSSTTTSPQWINDHPPIPPQVSVASSSSASAVNRDLSSNHSSPSNAVVGSTVILTPPSPAPAPVIATMVDNSVPSTLAAAAAIPSTSSAVLQEEESSQPSGSMIKMDKKNREHKKEKKDRIKKKNKKDKVRKDKVEKKKMRDELKIKLKKEKREKKKEKDMLRGNISEIITVPKLTLKLGSPPSKTVQQDQTVTDSGKLTVKPIILRKEESSSVADDGEKQRESSPELARISPLVTGQPKPKAVQPPSASTSNAQHNSELNFGTKKFPVFKPIPRLAEIVTEEATISTVVTTHTAVPQTTTGPVPPSKYIDSQGNEVWICPHCGKQDDGSPMIGCDDCDAWYHWVCVNMQVPPEENEDWYCKNCIKKKMQSSLLPEKKKKRKKKDKKEH